MVLLSAYVMADVFTKPPWGVKIVLRLTTDQEMVPPLEVRMTRPDVATAPTWSRSTGLAPTPCTCPRSCTPAGIGFVADPTLPITVQLTPEFIVL